MASRVVFPATTTKSLEYLRTMKLQTLGDGDIHDPCKEYKRKMHLCLSRIRITNATTASMCDDAITSAFECMNRLQSGGHQ